MNKINKIINNCEKYGDLQQSTLELNLLLSWLQCNIKIKNFLEIGCHHGGTFRAWSALSVPNGKRIAIDTVVCKKAENTMQATNGIMVNGDSAAKSTINKVKEILNGELLDWVFVDGKHTGEYVQKDYENYFTMLRSGGAMGFHDVHLKDIDMVLYNICKPTFYITGTMYPIREREALNTTWAGIAVKIKR